MCVHPCLLYQCPVVKPEGFGEVTQGQVEHALICAIKAAILILSVSEVLHNPANQYYCTSLQSFLTALGKMCRFLYLVLLLLLKCVISCSILIPVISPCLTFFLDTEGCAQTKGNGETHTFIRNGKLHWKGK